MLDFKIHTIVEPNIDPQASINSDNEIREICNKEDMAILRLYNFKPAAICVGRNLPFRGIDVEKAQADGVHLVNRITTGGALYISDDDFVMSLAISKHVFPENYNGLRMYAKINQAIVKSLQKVGIGAVKSEVGQHPTFKSVQCFGGLDPGELVDTDGRKCFGGDLTHNVEAGYFQNGYIPLNNSAKLLQDYISHKTESALETSDLSHYKVRFDDLAEVFIQTLFEMYPEWQPS